jgi:hypothetical protein
MINLKKNPLRSLYGVSKYNIIPILNSLKDHFKKYQLSVHGQNLISKSIKKQLEKEPIRNILEYYKRSPMEIAQDFVLKEYNLEKFEIDRLMHEGGYKEREYLEKYLSVDDPVILSLSTRLSALNLLL